MIKIALIEDSKEYARQFKDLVERYKDSTGREVDFRWFVNGFDFLETYIHDYTVVFMDIEMPQIDGLELAKQLRRIDPDVPLIFVTVMSQLAIKGYEVSAMDFIVKPISYFNFALKLEKAIEIKRRDRAIVMQLLDDDGCKQYIDCMDIYYVESTGHRCDFHTRKGDFHRYGSIGKLEEELRQYNFLRCNSSYIVNSAYITEANSDCVTVAGTSLPIARARKKKFMESLTQYFKHRY